MPSTCGSAHRDPRLGSSTAVARASLVAGEVGSRCHQSRWFSDRRDHVGVALSASSTFWRPCAVADYQSSRCDHRDPRAGNHQAADRAW